MLDDKEIAFWMAAEQILRNNQSNLRNTEKIGEKMTQFSLIKGFLGLGNSFLGNFSIRSKNIRFKVFEKDKKWYFSAEKSAFESPTFYFLLKKVVEARLIALKALESAENEK